MLPPFTGTGTALATPFHADGAIDFESFGKLIDFQIAGGVEALVPCGSTGEAATMTHDEKLAVIQFTVQRVRENPAAHKPKVIAGTGLNATDQTVQLTCDAAAAGVDAVLLVSPYYNKPSQRGLLAHFGAVAGAVPQLAVVLYNVPSRTGSNMAPETTVELATRYSNVVAIKEASGDLDQCSQILRDAPQDFALYSGEDSLTLPLLALGARGVIAVVSNQVPKEYGHMVRLALSGDYAGAAALHRGLFALMRLNFVESNPVPVKDALHQMGIFASADYRLPLVGLSQANRQAMSKALAELGLIKA